MSRTAWRRAGVLALGHVVVVLVGISQQNSPRLGDDAATVAAEYADSDMTRTFAGGYVEALGFLFLLPVVAFLARAVGRRTETGGWAAQTAFAAGTGHVLVSLAPGMAAGPAALYGAQHGADLATVSVVNDVRNFAFFLSMLRLGVHTVGVGIGVLGDRVLPTWLGWSAVGTAAVFLGSVPFARIGGSRLRDAAVDPLVRRAGRRHAQTPAGGGRRTDRARTGRRSDGGLSRRGGRRAVEAP